MPAMRERPERTAMAEQVEVLEVRQVAITAALDALQGCL